jgi:uncharacterized protein YkwD
MKSLVVLTCSLLAAGPVSPAGAPAPRAPAQAEAEADSMRVLELVNAARRQGRRCGTESFPPAPPLAAADALREAARHHALDMARRNYFAHRGADGSQPKDRVKRAGYQPRLTGENIAFGAESAAEVVAGWLDSPGHCANILDPRFRDTGVALAIGREPGHIYWVQTFGQPAVVR